MAFTTTSPMLMFRERTFLLKVLSILYNTFIGNVKLVTFLINAYSFIQSRTEVKLIANVQLSVIVLEDRIHIVGIEYRPV